MFIKDGWFHIAVKAGVESKAGRKWKSQAGNESFYRRYTKHKQLVVERHRSECEVWVSHVETGRDSTSKTTFLVE